MCPCDLSWSDGQPHLFDGLNPLFEHLLFSRATDLSKKKATDGTPPTPTATAPAPAPLLQQEGEILDVNLLSQLAFFLGGASLFRRLRPLYFGSDAGFSLGSFETRVFNWRAPTILLVSGTRISDPPSAPRERAFADTLPPKRFPAGSHGNRSDDRVVYGAYLSVPWKQTHKECFGDASTVLFQLSPIHEVFPASTLSTEYASFTKPPVPHAGIGFGSAPPRPRATSGMASHAALGPASLHLDASLEFGVFTHDADGGGSFRASAGTRAGNSWQDRFAVDALEVWGVGGDDEERSQRERWAWEEREAERRRRINVGQGDVDADRALLEMAGLVGQNRSGGSMG